MLAANTGQSSRTVANPKNYQNSTGSTRSWATSKPAWGGAYHAFDFAKYGARYLGAFVYRFNRRFHLEAVSYTHLTLPTSDLV